MSDDELTLGEIGRTLARLERKLDAVTDDHEKRLRWLERVAYSALAAGLGGLVTGLSSLFGGG